MSFTYTGDPLASDIAAVRFEVSDTDPDAPLFGDAEIGYAIVRETDCDPSESEVTLCESQVFSSAARCCEILARNFALQADKTVGDLVTTYSAQAKNFAARAAELRAKAQGMHSPHAVLTHSEKRNLRSNRDLIRPAFRREQFDNPYAGRRGGGIRPGTEIE